MVYPCHFEVLVCRDSFPHTLVTQSPIEFKVITVKQSFFVLLYVVCRVVTLSLLSSQYETKYSRADKNSTTQVGKANVFIETFL